MQNELDACSSRRTRSRVIVGCRADPAEAEDDVGRCKRSLERGGDELGLVADIGTPRELQTARGERLDHFRHVLVLPLAGQDFVTDDDCAEVHSVSRKPCYSELFNAPTSAP